MEKRWAKLFIIAVIEATKAKAAFIPPEHLNAVVSLGVCPLTKVVGRDGKPSPVRGNFDPRASGLLYSYTLSRRPAENGMVQVVGDLYLVTNKHVVEDLLGFENQQIAALKSDGVVTLVPKLYMRFNPQEAPAPRDFELPMLKDNKPTCLMHSSMDVAICPLDNETLKASGVDFWAFDNGTDAANRAMLKILGVTEGDGVFALGFPVSLSSGGDVVVSRQGSVARIRDFLSGANNIFLADLFIFPGNSGGPVILKPEAFALSGTKPHNKALLLGIVSEYIAYRDVAVSRQTGRERIAFEENSGLVKVIPVDFIDELILEHRKTRHLSLVSPPN